jgi:hexosaminidase
LTVAVGSLPFNFQLGGDLAKIVLSPPRTPQGELEVRDGCAGELVASLPLARAVRSDGITTLTAFLPPRPGRHDLCLAFTARSVDPIPAVDWVQFQPFAAGASPPVGKTP